MNPSNEFIRHICDIYNDYYDDRIEESNPPTAGNNPKTAGEDWRPGVAAAHKSLVAFQKELEEEGSRKFLLPAAAGQQPEAGRFRNCMKNTRKKELIRARVEEP